MVAWWSGARGGEYTWCTAGCLPGAEEMMEERGSGRGLHVVYVRLSSGADEAALAVAGLHNLSEYAEVQFEVGQNRRRIILGNLLGRRYIWK